jgi:hypothetical protein
VFIPLVPLKNGRVVGDDVGGSGGPGRSGYKSAGHNY